MDPDLLLAIALSENLMDNQNSDNQNEQDNEMKDNNNNNSNDAGEKPEEVKVDRINIYFRDLINLLKKEKVSKDLKPLYSLFKSQQLHVNQFIFITKVLESISFLLISEEVDDSLLESFSKEAIEFCLNTLEKWGRGEIDLASVSEPYISGNNAVPLILVSIIDMLCCLEYSEPDTAFYDHIPSFLNISNAQDILECCGVVDSVSSPATSSSSLPIDLPKEEKLSTPAAPAPTTESTTPPITDIFNQFLNNGFKENNAVPVVASVSNTDKDTTGHHHHHHHHHHSTTATATATGSTNNNNSNTQEYNNEQLVKNNSIYFNNTLRGPSRLLSICSKLLLPFQTDLVVSDKFENFKKNEQLIYSFTSSVQDILFSEGFDTLDISSIPWTIDFIGRLIGTLRSYQSYAMINHLSMNNSKFLSKDIFENLFEVIGTKLNYPDLRMKAEIFFSICILSDASKMNINIQELVQLKQNEIESKNLITINPQLIILAVQLVFKHFEDLKQKIHDDNVLTLNSLGFTITPTSTPLMSSVNSSNNNNNNNTTPITKFLLDNQNWFDFLESKQYSFNDISNLFMKPQLIDTLFSLLYILSFKDNSSNSNNNMDISTPVNNNNNNNINKTPTTTTTSTLSSSSSITTPVTTTTTSATTRAVSPSPVKINDSYNGDDDYFGGLFENPLSSSSSKLPVSTPAPVAAKSAAVVDKVKENVESITKSKVYTFLSFIHTLVNKSIYSEFTRQNLNLQHIRILYSLLFTPSSTTTSANNCFSKKVLSNTYNQLLTSVCFSVIKNHASLALLNQFCDYLFTSTTHLQLINLPKQKLTFIAWVYVRRQLNNNNSNAVVNDQLVVSLWSTFLTVVKEKSKESTFGLEFQEIISLEFIYLLLFSFHSLDEKSRLDIVDNCLTIINQVVVDLKSITPNSLLFSRLLLIVNYIIQHFDSVSPQLSFIFSNQVLSFKSIKNSNNNQYSLSLVNLNYKDLISSSGGSNNIEFYELQFDNNSWINIDQHLVLQAKYSKITKDYNLFYSNLIKLATDLVVPLKSVQCLDYLYSDYISSTALMVLSCLPPPTPFMEKIYDANCFSTRLDLHSCIYMSFLKACHNSQKNNNSIPWFKHTENILNQLYNSIGVSGVEGDLSTSLRIVSSTINYLGVIFNKSVCSASTSNNLEKEFEASDSYFSGGWSLFDEDEEEEDSSSSSSSSLSNSSNMVSDKESSTSAKDKDTPTVDPFLTLLPALFKFLTRYLIHYKNNYKEILVKPLSHSNKTDVKLIQEIYALCPKSDTLNAMKSLTFSDQDKLVVERWDNDHKVDGSLVSKQQKQSFNWLLQPSFEKNLIATEKQHYEIYIAAFQNLIRSILSLSDHAFSIYSVLQKDTTSTVVVDKSVLSNLLNQQLLFTIDYTFSSFLKEHESFSSFLSGARSNQLNSHHKLTSMNNVLDILLLGDPAPAASTGHSRYKSLDKHYSSNSVVMNLVMDYICILFNTAKLNGSYVYCFYMTGVLPMGDQFEFTLPVGSLENLFWILMDSTNVALNQKVLNTLIKIMTIPTPPDFITSIRSSVIDTFKSIDVDNLKKWFQQKLLGLDGSNPTTVDNQEQMVKFVGLLIGSKEFSSFSKDFVTQHHQQQQQLLGKPKKDEEDDEEDQKKKKPAKKKESATTSKTSSPVLTSSNSNVITVVDIDWDEKVADFAPILLNVLLSILPSAFGSDWIQHPKLLKVYFDLLQYLAMDQHQLLTLFKEISNLNIAVSLPVASVNELESFNLILGFVENILLLAKSCQKEDPASAFVNQHHHHHHHQCGHALKDEVMASEDGSSNTTDESILLDSPDVVFSDEDDEDSGDELFDDEKNSLSVDNANSTNANVDEEDEEKKLASKLCTYSVTKNDYIDQHWYFCFTCGLKFSEGCCSVCVKVCHKGHQVSYSRFSRFFCDCGAGAARPCKALKPRQYQPPAASAKKNTAASAGSNKVVPMEITTPTPTPKSTAPADQQTGNTAKNNDYFLNIPNQKDKQELYNEIIQSNPNIIAKLSELFPTFIDMYKNILNNPNKKPKKQDNKQNIFNETSAGTVANPEIVSSFDMLVQKKTTKYGAFDVKLKLEGSDGNLLKTLIANGPLQRRALASNSRGVLAIAENDTVSLINFSKLLDDESTIDKSSFKVLSKSSVGFPIIGLVFNPANEKYLAVVGMRECKILTINHKEEIVDQLVIDLSLEALGETIYIIKVEWIIGSQVELAVVTNEFIKIYDLSKDNLSPIHFFSLLEDSIKDMCLVSKNSKNYILALSASGLLYFQPIQDNNDNESCIMIETLQVPVNKVTGGVNVFSSPELNCVICTYSNGECHVLELNDTVTDIVRSFEITDPSKKISMPSQGFLQLTPNFSNYFTCFASRSTSLLTFKLTLGQVTIQQQKINKVEGMTWVNRASPKLLVLLEDGSLVRYDYTVDNPLSSKDVVGSSSVSTSTSTTATTPKKEDNEKSLEVLEYLKLKKQISEGLVNNNNNNNDNTTTTTTPTTTTTANTVEPVFPIDFFENVECITPSVKYGGDPLQYYSQDVIKQRLSFNDEYVVCQSLESMNLIIYNSNNSSNVICGIRVLVGNASVKHIPTEFRIYNRVIPVKEGMKRWYDIPLTNEEALKSSKKVTLVAGPSFTLGNSPIIDQIEVYGKAKSSIGWDSEYEASTESQQKNDGESSDANSSNDTNTPIELLLLHSVNSLKNYFSLGSFDQSFKQKALDILPMIMTDTQLGFMRSSIKNLLKILSGDYNSYLSLKHNIQLKYANQTITQLLKQSSSNSLCDMDLEKLDYLVGVLKKISYDNPKDIELYLFNERPNFFDNLMTIFLAATQSKSKLNSNNGNGKSSSSSAESNTNNILVSEEFINNYVHLLWNSLKSRYFSTQYIFGLLNSLISHPNELIKYRSSITLISLISKPDSNLSTGANGGNSVPGTSTNSGNNNIATPSTSTNSASVSGSLPIQSATGGGNEEDVQMVDEVLFSCDSCSVYPITGKRWNCDVCGDYDLCNKCYQSSNLNHPKDHRFVEYIVDEPMIEDSNNNNNNNNNNSTSNNDNNASGENINDNNNDDSVLIDDIDYDEELKLAISMSLNVDSPSINSELNNNSNNKNTTTTTSSSTIVGTDDIPSQIFNLALNEIVSVYSKGFSTIVPYIQIIHACLTTHSAKILMSKESNANFIKVVLDLLSKHNGTLDKYVSQKTNTLESDTMIFLLLCMLLNSEYAAKAKPRVQGNTLSSVFIYQLSDLLMKQGAVDLFKNWINSIFKSISNQKQHQSSTEVFDTPFGSLLVSTLDENQLLPKNRFAPFFGKSVPSSVYSMQLLLSKSIFKLLVTFYRCERRSIELNNTHTPLISKLDWTNISCAYIHSKKTTTVVKYPKKLLLLLYQSKSSYYSIRDEYLLKKKFTGIKTLETVTKGFSDEINYDHLSKLISYLSLMLQVASDRPHSWQYFCFNNDVLNHLFNILFNLEEGPTSLLLELLTYVFVNVDENNSASSPKHSGDDKDVDMKEVDTTTASTTSPRIDMKSKHIQIFLQEKYINLFIYNLLLEPNSLDLRTNASNFMFYLWKACNTEQRLFINRMFWSKLETIVSYGKNANEFMELLTYFINEIDPQAWKDQYEEFSYTFVNSFKSQNKTILNHPNSQIYNSLSYILDFDGYYLEAEPCLVCNNPEVPYNTFRLDILKQEVKYTESAQLVKFHSVFNIQKLHIQLHDAKKGKMIKTINLYYNNKPVSDIGELKGKFNQWKKLKQINFAPNQTDKVIVFEIPITARNFMIEYFDFHDNLSALSSEKLQCPRCSRTVTDKHGICKNCHENAYQCKHCRNINYENLDAFLCNECGFCKHARFEYSFTCQPTLAIERIENAEDHKRAIANIDKESENAHKKYQRLLSFKKIISHLITSFQTQDSWPGKDDLLNLNGAVAAPAAVTTAAATTSTSSIKTSSSSASSSSSGAGNAGAGSNSNSFVTLRINKKIGYLSRLYEKECNHLFEGLSSNVQTLTNTRIEISRYMNSLSKAQADHEGESLSAHNHDADEGPSPKIREATHCYGCSNAFIEQSLSFLNYLCRNPNFTPIKEIMIQAGISKDIFNHNIHQGKTTSRTNARLAMTYLTKNNSQATLQLNGWIKEKIDFTLVNYSFIDVASLISSEMQLLKDCSLLSDSYWEGRFRFVMEIFFKSIEKASQSPVISEYIILPCLKIILSLCTLDRNDPHLKKDTTKEPKDIQKSLETKFSKLRSKSNSKSSSGGVPSETSKDTTTTAATAVASTTTTASDPLSLFESESSVKYEEWVVNDQFDSWSQKYSNFLFNEDHDLTKQQQELINVVATSPTTTSTLTPKEAKEKRLVLKYGSKWRAIVNKSKPQQQSTAKQTNGLERLFEDQWIKKLLFSSSSSIRSEIISLMGILSRSSSVRTLKILDLLRGLIPFASKTGEYSAEFFGLFNSILHSEERKIYLAVKGFIPELCDLIISEIERIKSKESSFSTVDLSQGFVLKTLVTILTSFTQVPNLKAKMKRDNIIEKVLDAFLCLRGVLVQKNKLTEDSVKQLQELMKSLNTESVEDNKKFMTANIKALDKHRNDGRTPIFIFEQLCNIVCPVKPEPVYQLILFKAQTQEEYIRGSMNRNPYASNSIGGPLMRDVKNKICKTLDLGSFLDDDNGMELLVDNKIIKLDLPIRKVYEQVWKRSPQAQRSPDTNVPMTVIYRLQGLDGEATEEIIETLNDNTSEEKDPEEEFEITSVMAQCGGLDAMISVIENIKNFTVEKELAQLVIKLLYHCVKIKVNRRKLLTLNTVGRLLEKLKGAFHQPDLAEYLLIIIETVVSEANRDYLRGSNNSANNLSNHKNSNEAQDQMVMFLDKLNSPLVRSNPKIIEAMTRIIPFLTYGHEEVMEYLVDFFINYLDFNLYDQEKHKDTNFTNHLDFFAKVLECTRPDNNGQKLRSIIKQRGITQTLIDYLLGHFPEDKDKTSDEWLDSLAKPALPFVLVLFKGLCLGHEPTQTLALESNIIKRIHVLEETSTSAKIGSLSENLLETLLEGNEKVAKVITQIRKDSRLEKLKQAEKHREGVLKELGLAQSGKHITANIVPGSIEDIVEEDDDGFFTCMVCREGYSFKPEDVLGIYTYSKRIPLHPFNETTVPSTGTSSNNPTSPGGSNSLSNGFTTVTHFNMIHFFCHRDASKADRHMKVPKEEWEGAALRNQQTKCNNLFPIQGPKITNDAFNSYSDKYWVNLNSMQKIDGSRFRILAHDLKFLFIRFAKEESFSVDSKGGGKESNLRMAPFFIQLGSFILDQKASSGGGNMSNQLRRPHFEKVLSQFLALPNDSALQSQSSDNVPYYLVLTLYMLSLKDWEAQKLNSLTKLMAYAFSDHFSKNNNSPSPTDISSQQLFTICQPWLLFYSLVSKLHSLLKTTNNNNNSDWIQDMKTNLSNHANKIQQEIKELLNTFEEELLLYADESEFFDDLGVLKYILQDGKDPNTFLKQIYTIQYKSK
ncbi:hypothetical protein CYY_000970 [Polysphondylium violaceum]|uniref:UBR-type domain-containing protein n=1 Tax=Polysphondylium violaceum TaxID=133409 RepID=A0A8J4Q0K9_9MYCE|nr:hypothetical protein CYY_000970 [Polysphondylium violaceum]